MQRGESAVIADHNGVDAGQALLDLQRHVAGCLDLDRLLGVLASKLPAALPVSDRVSLVFAQPDGVSMRIHRLLPVCERRPGDLPEVRIDGTVVGEVYRTGTGRVVEDVRSDRNITFGHASHDRIRSTISVPVWSEGRIVGVMSAGTRAAGGCTEAMLARLESVAGIVGPAVFAAESLYETQRAPTEPGPSPAGDRLVGCSDGFRSLIATAKRVARTDADVLITGETGSGKTALARAIHEWSERRSGPFVTVHLADLSPSIIESELFGHERGAFTGASTSRIGRFESAHGGTIFLDELGETPLLIQSKLLRVVQDRAFERVGGGQTIAADVRIIAATGAALRQAVARGEFREDLYYRLNVVPLSVPPLRSRQQDLEPLVAAILDRVDADRERPRGLTPDAWARLRAYSWPGNIRELESVLRRAAIFEDGDQLDLIGFPESSDSAPAIDHGGWPTLEEHERRYICRVLELTGGVIEGADGAAQLLGLRPSTLRSRMKKLGVSPRPMRQKRRRTS